MFFLIFLVLVLNYSTGFQCKNENNEAVDWFTVYKIPKLHNGNRLIKEGVGYIYITPSNIEWTFSLNSINASNSMIGNTLGPLYTQDNASYVIYNDQPPSEPSKSSKGHTKGVILANLEGGLWLVHSVPHFPALTPKYEFSKTGLLKGQSFLCISLDLKNLNKVGVQLQYNEPQIYASNISTILEAKLSEIVKTVSGVVVQNPPWYKTVVVNSRSGTKFTSFAKSRQFGKDLYEDWVAPALRTDLYVETWLNGPGRLASDCSKPFKVYNIESVRVANASFNDSQDHSKWAVAANSSWICIGDINRMEHQKFRGGGTVCFNNETLSKDYKDSVVTIEKCAHEFN